MSKPVSPKRNIQIMLLDPQDEYLSWSQQIEKSDVASNWDILRIDDPETLLSRLEQKSYDAILITNSVQGYRELDVLRRALKLRPETLRFQLGTSVDTSAGIAQKLELTHRIFDHPEKIESVANTLNYLLKMRRLIRRPALLKFISQQKKIPAAPHVYKKLSHELNSQSATSKTIAEIVEQDPLLSARIIQIVNSPYFGLTNEISQISEAISLIGIRTLRDLAISTHMSGQFPAHPKWKFFSFDKLNERSLLVARFAKELCKDMKTEKGVTEQAFLAGLLHDVGVLIMASQDPQSYLKVLQCAVKDKRSLHSAEKLIMGMYHGEVGASLMALWNIPPLAVEAILLHPVPKLSNDTNFTALSAVHIADALIPPVWQSHEAKMNSELSESYLERIGVKNEVHRWRLMATDYRRAFNQN